MKGIVRKIISTVAAAAVAFTVMTVSGAPGSVAEAAVTENCDGNHDGSWTAINNANGFSNLSSGNYYLNNDVTLTSEIEIGSGVDVTLCLNGHTIDAQQNSRIFYITGGGSLTLCDCDGSRNGQGKLTGGKVSVGGAVSVYNGSFTMNGGTISGNTATGSGSSGGAGVRVSGSNATFTINGGTISDNTTGSHGSGVFVENGATFTMNGGTISNNTGHSGGGVCMEDSNSTFEMNGGRILNNTATSTSYGGGGVLMHGGNFTMKDGEISGNNATGSNGGGVNVRSGATFEMNGGTISNNTANRYGGGVNVDSTTSQFIMTGGTISGNITESRGGGVYQNGIFTINGKVEISGNTKSDSANNVYLPGKTITIGSDFDTTSKIGVITSVTPTCAKLRDVTGETTLDVSAGFTADENGLIFVYNDGKVQLSGAHDWSAWKITKDPTTTQTGTAERSCNNDSTHIQGRVLEALNDTTVWTKVNNQHVEPTATTPGRDVYTSIYGDVEVELPATGGGSNDNNPSGSSGDNNPSGGGNDNNPSGGSGGNNPSGGSNDNNPSGGSSDNNPSGGSSSGGSSSSSSSSEIALASDSKNPPTGSKTAVFPTAILAAAVMLLTKKRSR